MKSSASILVHPVGSSPSSRQNPNRGLVSLRTRHTSRRTAARIATAASTGDLKCTARPRSHRRSARTREQTPSRRARQNAFRARRSIDRTFFVVSTDPASNRAPKARSLPLKREPSSRFHDEDAFHGACRPVDTPVPAIASSRRRVNEPFRVSVPKTTIILARPFRRPFAKGHKSVTNLLRILFARREEENNFGNGFFLNPPARERSSY